MRIFFLAALLLMTFIACNEGEYTVTTSEQKQYSRPPADEERMEVKLEDQKNSYTPGESFNENYSPIIENEFVKATDHPLSTFSIDVDDAAYSNVRRFFNSDMMPPPGAVRIEEMINYFKYDYPQPLNNDPFTVSSEVSQCPWNQEHKLVHIGLQGKTIPEEKLPPSNLVFLIDVSGSMDSDDKLPLLQQSMKLLVERLRGEDRVAIVVYAGSAGLVLPSTAGSEKKKILKAIDNLEAGGSTAGGEGILLAYETARKNFITEGNNRIILATDGDFNVGVSSDDQLLKLIEKERESGVYLSVLGFGTGNYQDNKMQMLADNGNGNHSYIDNINEARKVLVREFGSTLFTIAKDVKIQIEFNPANVQAYRLIGYENRMLAAEDFNNDKKDAGEIGSGHTVTALYEVIPHGARTSFTKNIDPLKYQVVQNKEFANKSDLLTIKIRYKSPGENKSNVTSKSVPHEGMSIDQTSDNFRFSAAVAEFGLLLRNSAFKQNASYEQVKQLANSARGNDSDGDRKEFLTLVKKAEELSSE